MATHLPVIPGGHAEGFGATARTDNWWVGPAFTFVVFTTFVVLAFCADAALVAVAVKSVRRRSSSSTRS